SRAWQLSQRLYTEVTPHIFPILHGRWAFYLVRGAHRTALHLAEEFLNLAQRQHDPAIIVAHWSMGWSFCMGELVAARAHFEYIAALYTLEHLRRLMFWYGQSPGPAGLSVGALALWLLGYAEQARRWNEWAILQAHEAAHPYTLVSTLGSSFWLHSSCQEP